jgi:alkanesulfonate monooxygenase SsuD/methylene tetrahydromethanopterin reductase-like flavin-dependent oxidoreductase (luciferase family)
MRNGELGSAADGRTLRWTELREMGKLAEAVGFDTLFVADHLLLKRPPSEAVPGGDARGVWEAWTILAALAEATSRVTLGPFVACTSFRNPALLAKMADTLDDVSGGRLILGLGAGWHEPEYQAFGYPFDHLASRFAEALKIIVPLLREGRVNFEGQYYWARECELRPRGPRPNGPPIWIGASQPRMMRLVARYADAYNTVWHGDPSSLAEPFQGLEAACREVGRDPSTVLKSAGTFVALPGPEVRPTSAPDMTLTGSSEQIGAALHAFHTAGAEHVTCILDPWDAHGIERFGPVIEALRKLEA